MQQLTGPVCGLSGSRLRAVALWFWSDDAYKAKALARNSSDQLLILATVADRSSRGIDATGHVRIRHNSAAPDRSDELVFTDQAVPILQKIEQHIEYLGLNGNGLGTEAKFAPVRVNYVVCKNKMHVAAPVGWAIALKNNQGKLKNISSPHAAPS